METIFAPAGSAAARTTGPTLTSRILVARTLLAGLALGILGDTLLRQGPSGVGFTLFVLSTIGALAVLMRARAAKWTLGACLLLAPTLFFALVFVWRGSEALRLFNFLALAVAMAGLATALVRGEDWDPMATVGGYLRGGWRVAFGTAFGSATLLHDAEGLRALSAPGRLRNAGAAARGAVIALPVLLLFGSLLTAADPVFARLVNDAFDIDFGEVAAHVMGIAFVSWVAAGYLRTSMFAPGDEAPVVATRGGVGAVEIGVVLGALDVLFLGFVLVQLRYLFGGDAHVVATGGVSYAEYARSGFFELVWVTVLVLPLLLLCDAALRPGDGRAQLTFRALASTLLVLLAVVMASAMERMWLYQRAYGLTGTRLYASVAMVWLAIVFLWFALTVLRGRRAPFAFGGIVSAWLVLAALDFSNPEALIARTNLARMERGERFDASYLSMLGADATPAVVEAVSTMSEGDRCVVVKGLLGRLEGERDWRAWNLARASADRALRTNAGALQALRCTEPEGAAKP